MNCILSITQLAIKLKGTSKTLMNPHLRAICGSCRPIIFLYIANSVFLSGVRSPVYSSKFSLFSVFRYSLLISCPDFSPAQWSPVCNSRPCIKFFL